jgi:hypothetical protein
MLIGALSVKRGSNGNFYNWEKGTAGNGFAALSGGVTTFFYEFAGRKNDFIVIS